MGGGSSTIEKAPLCGQAPVAAVGGIVVLAAKPVAVHPRRMGHPRIEAAGRAWGLLRVGFHLIDLKSKLSKLST
jgi:hypothetical protein